VSNGFIKVDILGLIKGPSRKVVGRKNETFTTLLEFLEGYFCRMDNKISRENIPIYWSAPRNTHSDDI
jgi:hypothetical protein